MTSSPPLYLSYLLRLWLAGDGGQPQWRVSLEDPRTGERRGFACLAELVAFLEKEIKDRPQTGDCPRSLEDERR